MSEKGNQHIFSLQNTPKLAIFLILIVFTGTNFVHHRWTRDKGPDRGVIHWDIISYYAYLPATFIYRDVKLGFLDEDIIENDNKFWFYPTETGEKLIITTLGMSVLYSPFFFMAHLLAPVFGEPRSGFNSIYQFFLVFGALFYVGWGFYFLKLVLCRFFSNGVAALTLLAIGLGTNLYNYATFDAAMSHCYNFALITLLLYLTIRWYEKPRIGKAVGLGFLMGLIFLVRPSNVLVLLFFLLWGVASGRALLGRIRFYLKEFHYVVIMAVCVFIVWIPQLLYWKAVTGHFVYNSYGPHGGNFYFGNPHIIEILFSYRKGWFLYTPVMMLASIGLIPLYNSVRNAFWGTLLYLLVMIYVQASWWSWWFGGGFSGRTFIDMYGVMALPLAALMQKAAGSRRKMLAYGVPGFVGLLILFQVFQTWQFFKGAIHYMGMTKETYWLTFFRMEPRGKYWQLLSMPDSQLGRLGIYVYYPTGEDNRFPGKMDREQAIRHQMDLIREDPELMKDIIRYSRRESESVPQVIRMVAERMYNEKTN